MSNHFRATSSVWIVATAAIVAAVFAPVFVTAQQSGAAQQSPVATKAAAKSDASTTAKAAGPHSGSTVPRTPDGHPDLSGIWSNATLTPLERPADLKGKQYLTEAEAAAFEKKMIQKNDADIRNPDPEADVAQAYNNFWYDRGNKVVPSLRTSLIVDPPDGMIPALTPEAKKREAARAEARRGRGSADSYEDRNNGERCITRGAPKLPSAYNNNFQIVQSPGYIAIYQEMMHETRVIPLDGSPHVGAAIRLYMGDPRGHWEGNTLVVDTTNFNDQIVNNNINCCRSAGANLHVIERFTRVDAHTIDYQYTIDDPTTYTKPWTVAVPLTLAPGPIYEYACHEDNYAIANMLRGARADEKARADAGKTSR